MGFQIFKFLSNLYIDTFPYRLVTTSRVYNRTLMKFYGSSILPLCITDIVFTLQTRADVLQRKNEIGYYGN